MCDVDLMKLRVKCQTPDEPVSVYVVWKRKEQMGVCKPCWERIADKNWECGKDPRPTVESLLSDKARGLEGATLTEYKHKNKKAEENDEQKEDEDY
jgi:hypothetical protein